jgi:hypothetical protein
VQNPADTRDEATDLGSPANQDMSFRTQSVSLLFIEVNRESREKLFRELTTTSLKKWLKS